MTTAEARAQLEARIDLWTVCETSRAETVGRLEQTEAIDALIAAVRAEERARIVKAVRKDGPRLRNMGSYWVNAIADFIEADAVPERRQEGV